MGSTFISGATKATVIAECLGYIAEVEEHCVKGNVLWTVGKDSRGERFIGCFKLMADRKFGWGFKAMDESCGPCYYDVPLRYLELQPLARNEYSKGWRVKVQAFHAAAVQQRAKLKAIAVGATLVLKEGCTPSRLTVVQVKPLRARSEQGGTFRVSPRLVSEVIAREPVAFRESV